MEISTDLFRTFLTLCELRSFSKAAKKLWKSQSAVSTQIGLLEDRTGQRLFDRSERPLKLTEAGEILYSFSLEHLNKLEDLDRLLKEFASGVRGEIFIAASTSVGTYLLPKLLTQIIKNSKIKLTIVIQRLDQVYESIRRADQDFAITFAWKPPSGLVTKQLINKPLCLVVSARHPLAKNRVVSVRELRTVPFVGGFHGSAWPDMIDMMLRQKGIMGFPVALRVNHYQAIKEAVLADLGVAVLPEFTVQQELDAKTLCKLTVKNVQLVATIMLIERKRQIFSPGVNAVKTFLEKKIVDDNFEGYFVPPQS